MSRHTSVTGVAVPARDRCCDAVHLGQRSTCQALCTAGLPALYSQILTMQQLPRWQEYLYLGLSILAYMFDDTLMVLGVVATLAHPKMQEVHGRWLKLLSAVVILALGLVMLLRPEWLG